MSDLSNKDLGVRLRGFRFRRGWKLKDLSERTGIPESTLLMYERGQRTPPGNRMIRLMVVLDIEADDLIDNIIPVEV